jgi:hypothetical protein
MLLQSCICFTPANFTENTSKKAISYVEVAYCFMIFTIKKNNDTCKQFTAFDIVQQQNASQAVLSFPSTHHSLGREKSFSSLVSHIIIAACLF